MDLQALSLNLWDNSIGDVGAKAIAASLHGLTSLYLKDNSIGEGGAKEMLDAWSTEAKSWWIWVFSTFQVKYAVLLLVAGVCLWRWLI